MLKLRSAKSIKKRRSGYFPVSSRPMDFQSKTVQKGIRKMMKKSRQKKCAKMMPKGRKGMQNAPKMASKIEENPYKNRYRKGMEKTLEKH